MRVLATASLAALVLTSAALAGPPSFKLRPVAQTSKTVTLAWTRQPGADGYQFLRNGVVISRTFNRSTTTATFWRGSRYAVDVLHRNGGKLTRGTRATFTPVAKTRPRRARTALVFVPAPKIDFTLVVASKTPKTITFRWKRQPGADGYLFLRNGVVISRTFVRSTNSATFWKGRRYEVRVLRRAADKQFVSVRRAVAYLKRTRSSGPRRLVSVPAPRIDFRLRLASRTSKTLTFAWKRQPGADGYRFLRNGVVISRTFDRSTTSATFWKGTRYAVDVLKVTHGKRAVVVRRALAYTRGAAAPARADSPGAATPSAPGSGASGPAPSPPKAGSPSAGSGSSTPSPPAAAPKPAPTAPKPTTPTTPTPAPPPPTSGGSASVYLSSGGSDAAACTASAPCRSLQRGFQVAAAGAVISVAGGTYAAQSLTNAHRQVTFRASGSVKFAGLDLTCTTGITLEGIGATQLGILAGNDSVTVRGGSFGGGSYSPDVEGDPVVIGDVGSCSQGDTSNGVLLDGIEVGPYLYPGQNAGSAHPDCLQLYGGSDGVTIRNSTFHDCEQSFIGAYPDFGDIRNVVIEGTTFRNVTDRTYWMSQWGQAGHSYRCDGIVLRGNTFDPNNPGALEPYSPLRTECWNMVVEGNTFLGSGPGQSTCDDWRQAWNALWRNNTFNRGGACSTG